MKPLLGPYSSQIYSIARIVIGFLYWQHGAQKIFAAFGQEQTVDLFSRLGLAGIIEFVGGGLIVLGLFTPWAAFVASGELAVAYFLAHFPRGFWPIMNGGEPAVLFCFMFLFIASRDSGVWSLDHLLWGHTAAPSGD